MAIYFSGLNDQANWHGTVCSMCMKLMKGMRNVDVLAPTQELVHGHKYHGKSDQWYIDGYKALLAERSADIRGFISNLPLDEDLTLLCYCTPGVFCHRRLLAKWFASFRPELTIYLDGVCIHAPVQPQLQVKLDRCNPSSMI